jgi:hypothetical protein
MWPKTTDSYLLLISRALKMTAPVCFLAPADQDGMALGWQKRKAALFLKGENQASPL